MSPKYVPDESQNCANVAAVGRVVDKGSDTPVQYVTLEVKGDKSSYKGPFYGTTNDRGDYTVLIGELKNDIDGVEFNIKVLEGPGVDSEDDFDWTVGSDCHENGTVQVMEVNWYRKSN